MELARYLYFTVAIWWLRLPSPVRTVIRHPFLTVAPLIIAACLIGAAVIGPVSNPADDWPAPVHLSPTPTEVTP
jgi:hypothetical protein